MESVFCLKSKDRKGQTSQESVNAVFFDVEKAYL